MSQSAERHVSPVFQGHEQAADCLGSRAAIVFCRSDLLRRDLLSPSSLVGGIALFVVGVIIAHLATKHDVEILRVLFNSSKFRRRYDSMKADEAEIRIARRNGQG